MADTGGLSLITLAIAEKFAEGASSQAINDAIRLCEEYTDEQIAQILSFDIEVVQELPQNPDDHTIYFVPKDVYEPENGYDEYIYVNNEWELIGSTSVDLSNYYTKTEVDNAIAAAAYSLPAATSSTLGGVKIDTTSIDVDNTGLIGVKENYVVTTTKSTIQPLDSADIAGLFT